MFLIGWALESWSQIDWQMRLAGNDEGELIGEATATASELEVNTGYEGGGGTPYAKARWREGSNVGPWSAYVAP